MAKKRNSYLDFVRGIAIYCVLWGHCIQYGMVNGGNFFENPIFKFIYSFHMPMFMLISGYLFYDSAKTKNISKLLVTRLWSLGIPLFVWGCVPKILKWILTINKLEHSSLKEKGFELIGSMIEGITGLWFLWAVLVISFVASFAEKVRFGGVKHHLAYGVILLGGYGFIYLMPGKENNLFMYPYFILGCWTNHFCLWNRKYNIKIKKVCVILYCGMLVLYIKFFNMFSSGLLIMDESKPLIERLSANIYRYTIGLVGSIAVLFLVQRRRC